MDWFATRFFEKLRPKLIENQGESRSRLRDLLLDDRLGRVLVGLADLLVEFQHACRDVVIL